MAKEGKDSPRNSNEKHKDLSRRSFLTGTAGVSTAVAVTGLLGGPAFGQTSNTPDTKRATTELPIPADAAPPKTTEYLYDVLVIGGGFAGLNAAIAARKAGQSVLMIDKGRPGYSGLSCFASSHRWFDPDFGDDAKAFRESIQKGGEYIVNLDWYQVWIDESKQAYQRLKEWKILAQYPKASKAGDYDKTQDFPGYREEFSELDRRTLFTNVLDSNGVQYLPRTMITDVVQQDGRVAGAMGFDVPSGVVLTFHAKAVILCTGGGSYKPSGFPTSSNTFDGEYIGYQLGLPIVGKEFDDFHTTISYAPGNAFLTNSWEYLENIWLCGGDVTAENAESNAISKGKALVQARVLKALGGLANNDGTGVTDVTKENTGRRGGTLSGRADDPRTGKANSPTPKEDIYGAAVGMCLHLTSGVFCGLDDLVGDTGVPGLYVAGDGANGSGVTGTAYPHGVGFTSNFCSIQGWRAGQVAARYAGSVPLEKISAERVGSVTKEILAPKEIKTGLDPNWARDVLQALMAPYWIHIAKSESALRGALAQVEHLRDEVVPKLMAPSAHDLRLCHEMKHKILSAEMKLRASLERQESRGLHYRTDYPFRDDKNFLCYITMQKAKDGSMAPSKVPVKSAWIGDLKQDYARRYGWRFPGEAKAMGLPEEKARSGNWG